MTTRKILPVLFIVAGVVLAFFLYNSLFNGDKPASATYTTLEEYNESIDSSCAKDSDCVIKDVGNCCGAYPRCVNENSATDPDFVADACSKENLSGICGFPSIDSCRCVNSTCEGFLEE